MNTNLVDSQQTPLPTPEVIMRDEAANTLAPKDMSLEHRLAILTKQFMLPDTDMVQVGNTVFVGHPGKGKQKNKMYGQLFNADPADNYVNNFIKYLSVLRKRGVTHYSADIETNFFKGVEDAVNNKLNLADLEGGVEYMDNGVASLYIRFPSNLRKKD